MFKLLPRKLEVDMPKPGEQEGNKNPTVYAVFYFPLSRWTWFATEGKPIEGDFLFFGYVVGLWDCPRCHGGTYKTPGIDDVPGRP